MQFGIHFHNHGVYADPRRLAELAREAEAAGWDGVFVCDYLTAQANGAPAPVANPWVALTAIALATASMMPSRVWQASRAWRVS